MQGDIGHDASVQKLVTERVNVSLVVSKLCYGIYTLCLKKVLKFELSVTLSNLKPIFKILHCWKAYEICYKIHTTLPTSP